MTWYDCLTVAQAATDSFETIEYSLPESAEGLLLLLGGFAALITLVVRTSLRDTRFLAPQATDKLNLGLLITISMAGHQRHD